MRVLTCIAVLGFTVSVSAEPKPDPATAHLPADAVIMIRIASLDRLDEIGNLRGVKGARGRRRWSDALLREFFRRPNVPVNRKAPVYLSYGDDRKAAMFPLPEGAAPERLTVRHGFLIGADSRGGVNWVPRRQPVMFPAGDFSLVVRLGALIDQNRALIDEFAMRDPGQLEAMGVPAVAVAALRVNQSFMRKAFNGVDEFRYGLTFDGESVVSSGSLTARPGSAMARAFATAAAAAGPAHDLARFLPREALYVSESSGVAVRADALLMELLEAELGKDAGRCVNALLSPALLFREHLTGRAASAVDIRNILAPGTSSFWELKPGTPIEQALVKFDVAPLNARLKALAIPARFVYDASIAKQAGVAIHRLQLKIDHPQFAALASQRKFCLAATNGLFLSYGGMDAVRGIRRLISRSGTDGKRDHPHLVAMKRLMPNRHAGLSFNLGALKPLAGLAASFVPELADFVRSLPGEIYLSTAIRLERTAMHFRGDWSLKTILDLLEAEQEQDEKQRRR